MIPPNLHGLTNCILAGKNEACSRLIQNCHLYRTGAIVFIEIPSVEDWDSKGSEITRRNDRNVAAWPLIQGRFGPVSPVVPRV